MRRASWQVIIKPISTRAAGSISALLLVFFGRLAPAFRPVSTSAVDDPPNRTLYSIRVSFGTALVTPLPGEWASLGSYSSPFCGHGVEFEPLGGPPADSGLALHETGFFRKPPHWNHQNVFSPRPLKSGAPRRKAFRINVVFRLTE
jgi:hypothetical protein